MFAKKSDMKSLGRLKKRSDFLAVQKNAKKWIAKGFIIEVADNDNLGLRYGLTVSKKVSKLAVLRNRSKRRLKVLACEALPDYAHHSIDIVLVGRQGMEERPYEQLKTDLCWCLRKLGYEKNIKDISD